MGVATLFLVAAPLSLSAQDPSTTDQSRALAQAQQVIQQLANEKAEARDTVAEQANELKALKHTIEQLQQTIAAIIPGFEAANPGKTLDPKTLVVKDKPVPQEAK